MAVPGIISAFILADIFKREGHDGFGVNCKILEMDSPTETVNGFHEEDMRTNLTTSVASEVELSVGMAEGKAVIPEKDSLSSGGCGSGCGGGCGSGCGNMVKSGGCGGCGGGCGGGGGCGSGCGNMVKSGGCGGCGGSGSKSAHENKAGNSCADEHLKETSIYASETVAA